MREILLIVQREFLERVRTRAFMLGTLVFPLFMAGIFVLPRLGGGGEERVIALVDESPAGLGDAFAAALTAAPGEEDAEQANTYRVERVTGSFEGVRDQLNARVLAEELYGYVVLPPTVLDSNEVVYRARNVANARVLRDIRLAANRSVQAERLQEAGLQGAELAELVRGVNVEESQVTATGQQGRSAQSAFGFAYIVAFLIYFMTIMYGTTVMRSVIEEKTNRISEVMVSSIRAESLMLGKVIGVCAAALLQVAVWAGLVGLLVTQSDVITNMAELPPGALQAFAVPLGSALLFVGYFIIGFFVYASIFAALGAAMTSEQEAQSVMMVAMVPLIAPLLFIIEIIGEPLGTAATVLGLFPLTAPIAMPMRIASGPIPASQIALSFLGLVIAVGAITWLAGKIYRVGILATGKKASVRDLVRWVRAT